ncbi:MAG: hypothetical protein U1E56_14340 [Bauldia sp.]
MIEGTDVVGGRRVNASTGATLFRRLTADDWPAVVELEEAAWPPSLRADRATVESRFALGHAMMGAWRGERLVGLGCYAASDADPRDDALFPRTFVEFARIPASGNPLTAYTYNLCIHPATRRLDVTLPLIARLMVDARMAGCRLAVGDGRCPSYNGSNAAPDRVRANRRFRDAIDAWQRSGQRPPDEDLILDPVLRFYRRTTGCSFIHLRPGFLPEDIAAGGFRVIFLIDLERATSAKR